MKWDKPIVYVTRDIEHALGVEPAGNYFVVSNNTEYGKVVQAKYPKNVHLVSSDELLPTSRILLLAETKKFIDDKGASVVVFVGNQSAEEAVNKQKLNLLNPSADKASEIEGKNSQSKWLGQLADLMPKNEIKILDDIDYKKPFILQFNFSHTGEGTFLIESKEKLSEFKTKFPKRPVRVADYIEGIPFTLNVIAAKNGIFPANISYQITGLPDFTDNPFSTVGNDWKLPNKILSDKEKENIFGIAEKVGEKMKKDGWRGLFGIDVILDEKSRKIYLLEINARQPASTTCESILQKAAGKNMTTFEAHIKALLGENVSEIQKIKDGAQIVLRIKAKQENHPVPVERLPEAGFSFIEYENTEHNADLSRVRSDKGIMEKHGKLNSVGEEISSIIFKK